MKVALVALLALSAIALASADDCSTLQCVASGATVNWTAIVTTDGRKPVCEGGSKLFVNSTSMMAWCGTPIAIGAACKMQGGRPEYPIADYSTCTQTNPGTTSEATYVVYKDGMIGDSCSTNYDCKPPRTCSSGKCATSVAVGGSCAPSSTTINGSPVCPVGSQCRGATSATSTCVANVAEGAECSNSGATAGCAAGLACFNTASVGATAAYKCVKWGSQVQHTQAFDFRLCASGYANKTGYCQPKPDVSAKLGIACTPSTTGAVDECGDSGLLECTCTMNSLISNTNKCQRTEKDVELGTLSSYISAASSAASSSCESLQPSFPGACEVSGIKSALCANYRYQMAGQWQMPPCNIPNPVDAFCNGAFSRMAAPLMAIAALVAVAFGAQW